MRIQKLLHTRLRDALIFIVRLFTFTRTSERLIEGLTLEKLQLLANYDGTLPYRNSVVRALVWELKYRASANAAALAGAYVADMLLAEAEDSIGMPLLVPVPMHAARRRERGHNQTELLCESALHVLGEGVFSYNPHVLIRTVNTKTQQGLEREKRLKNVKNSMDVARPELVRGRTCIVVDDVTTTGATFAEARRALKAAGASEVHCIALAQS